ncbi:hypothetical protein KKI19_02005 [Patescibacteria group bacterium]|nr:hypothetical protein [Patescibacteria group bacterium]
MSGALTGLSPELREQTLRFYEAVAEVASRHGIDLYLPHLHSDPIKDADIPPRQVVIMDRERVKDSITMIVDIRRPPYGVGSLGVGMEIGFCQFHNTNIIVLCRRDAYERFKNDPYERKVLEIPEVKAMILYETDEEALRQLDGLLEERGEEFRHKVPVKSS